MKKIHVIFIPVFLYSSVSLALDIEDLFSLPLEQLILQEVNTVSKRKELAVDAPGIVTIITAADMKSYGATNIKDVLLRVPNFYMFDSSTFTASGVTMRAGATQHLNNRVLYLINGRPIRESQNGGLHTDINLLFPVEALERIEVVRGPSSVLYGSNAFSGTVNFITKKPKDKLEGAVAATYGSENYLMLSASLQTPVGEKGGLTLRVNDLDTDGETVTAFDEAGMEGSVDLFREGTGVFINFNYAGFSLNSILNTITMPLSSGAFRWTNNADFELKREFYDLGYEHIFSDKWKASINYTYNKQEKLITGPGSSSSEFIANGYLYEITVNGQLAESLSMVVGSVVDQLQGDLGTRGGKYDNKRLAVYGQFDYQLLQRTKLSAGAQWNDPEGASSNMSPRLGLIHHFNDSWISKLLYSEAFRSPYGSELFFDSVFLLGDKNLKPELITTFDAQLNYTENQFYVSATYYHSVTEDAIGRAIVDGTNTFVNQEGEVTFDGLELEGRWNMSPAWKLQGSYNYQINEDDTGQKDVMPAARTMAKMGISYQSVRGYQIGFWNSYFGKASKLEDLEGNNTNVVNPPADAFNLLSINVQGNVGQLFNSTAWQKVEFSLFANNLLDETVYYPEMGRKRVNTYPQSHGRAIYASINARF